MGRLEVESGREELSAGVPTCHLPPLSHFVGDLGLVRGVCPYAVDRTSPNQVQSRQSVPSPFSSTLDGQASPIAVHRTFIYQLASLLLGLCVRVLAGLTRGDSACACIASGGSACSSSGGSARRRTRRRNRCAAES
jgi:hypothetical protein